MQVDHLATYELLQAQNMVLTFNSLISIPPKPTSNSNKKLIQKWKKIKKSNKSVSIPSSAGDFLRNTSVERCFILMRLSPGEGRRGGGQRPRWCEWGSYGPLWSSLRSEKDDTSEIVRLKSIESITVERSRSVSDEEFSSHWEELSISGGWLARFLTRGCPPVREREREREIKREWNLMEQYYIFNTKNCLIEQWFKWRERGGSVTWNFSTEPVSIRQRTKFGPMAVWAVRSTLRYTRMIYFEFHLRI